MAQTHRHVLPSVLLAVLCASTATALSRSLQGIPACTWPGHCLGDPCKTENDCDQNWICVSGKCAVPGIPACTWPGHCLGDPCKTENDCDQNWICVSGKCAVPGGPTQTPPPPPSTNSPRSPSTPPPTSSKRTTITSYNVMSFDNTSPGALAEYKVSQSFVNNVNIAAVHSMHWSSYKYRQVQITYQGKTAAFQVWDFCADSDCGGCCTANMNYNGNGFLLDLDSSAVKRIWGISNAENTLYDSATFVLLPTPVDVQGQLAKYP